LFFFCSPFTVRLQGLGSLWESSQCFFILVCEGVVLNQIRPQQIAILPQIFWETFFDDGMGDIVYFGNKGEMKVTVTILSVNLRIINDN